MTFIDSGALVLLGTLNGSSLSVNGNAAFTNTVTGRISGPGHVLIAGRACELDGTNDFTGGLTLSTKFVEALADIAYFIRNPEAMGAGSVSIASGSVNITGKGTVGRNRKLSMGQTGESLLYAMSDFTWLGDVELLGSARSHLRVDGTLTFGEPNCTTEVVSPTKMGLYVRQGGRLNWHSRLDIGYYHQTDGNSTYFYAPGNEWEYLKVQAGKIHCQCTNTLAVAPVQLGQKYGTHVFHPILHLNGFDQAISGLEMAHDSIDASSQTVTSDKPAILTITNDADTVTLRKQGRITGAVTLRKRGAGNWSFGCRNWSSGDMLVEAGTLTVTADDALPTNAVTSLLSIAPTAKVVLADGVNATVSRLSNGSFDYPAGVYGGEGCTAPGARIRPKLFAPGTGSLRVLYGAGGAVIILR